MNFTTKQLRLQAHLVEKYVKTEKAKLVVKLDEASPEEMRALLEQARRYDQMLKKVKGVARG